MHVSRPGQLGVDARRCGSRCSIVAPLWLAAIPLRPARVAVANADVLASVSLSAASATRPRDWPQISHRRFVKRRRQLSRTEIARAELARHVLATRRWPGWMLWMHVGPAEIVECPVGGAPRRLPARSRLAPAIARDRPARLQVPGQPSGLPRPEPSDPAAARFFDHREHADARRVPCADHRHCGRATSLRAARRRR